MVVFWKKEQSRTKHWFSIPLFCRLKYGNRSRIEIPLWDFWKLEGLKVFRFFNLFLFCEIKLCGYICELNVWYIYEIFPFAGQMSPLSHIFNYSISTLYSYNFQPVSKLSRWLQTMEGSNNFRIVWTRSGRFQNCSDGFNTFWIVFGCCASDGP